MGTEPIDPFFDRDKLEEMSDKDLKKLGNDTSKDIDTWNRENPDPKR